MNTLYKHKLLLYVGCVVVFKHTTISANAENKIISQHIRYLVNFLLCLKTVSCLFKKKSCALTTESLITSANQSKVPNRKCFPILWEICIKSE